MPHITVFGWCTWALVALAQLALAAVMLRTGAWRRWPSVFTYACIRTVGTFALMLMAHPTTDFGAACYFYSYWIEAAVLGVVQVWIIREIGLSVASLHKGIRRFLSRLVPAIALLYVLASLLIVDLPRCTPDYMQWFVVSANQATTVAWFATYLTLLLSCQALGVVCNALERGISAGFCALLAVHFVTGCFVAIGENRALLSEIEQIADVCALLGWIWIFNKKPPREVLPSVDCLRAELIKHTATVERLRNK